MAHDMRWNIEQMPLMEIGIMLSFFTPARELDPILAIWNRRLYRTSFIVHTRLASCVYIDVHQAMFDARIVHAAPEAEPEARGSTLTYSTVYRISYTRYKYTVP